MPSSLIDVLQRHREDADLLHLSAELSELAALSEGLDRLPDSRRVRGRRYWLGSLLALCLLAVLGGATTLAGIARYAIDTSPEARARIGLRRPPRATTLGRLLSRLDGDALDDAVGAWLARHASDPADERTVELVGVAVDGHSRTRQPHRREDGRPPPRRRPARGPGRGLPAADRREEQ
ncbi:transposase family protein [Streptomyces sp. NBC_00704]|uniref:transposase family protein n=1 Tax=unclassified Streptomyces TaxID=2593676 RepID=UPI002E36E456|nr:transposase family protein [Streptomyces sp. NBC_00704]